MLVALVTAMPAVPSQAQTAPRPRYEITATLDTTASRLEVAERLSFVNRTGQSLSSIVVRLPPAGVGAATIRRIEARGQSGDATVDGAVIEAPVDPPLAPGQRGDLLVEFSLELPRQSGRLSATTRTANLGNAFATLAVHRGDWDRRPHVEVGDAFVTEVADFRVSIVTIQPLELAFNGRLVSRDERSWTIEATNVRDLAVVASDRFTIASAPAGSSSVTAYAVATPAQELANAGARFAIWYESHFGAIPFPEVKVVETDLPTDYGGMEYPGLIMLSDGYGPLRTGSTYDSLIGHEVAHQWFYAFVGSDQINDPWLDEGFATYAPILYYLDTAPNVGQSMLRQLDSARSLGHVDASIYEFTDDAPYFAAIYRPAARFLNDVRGAMGDEAFFAAVRDYVALFGDRLAAPRAFLDLLQQRTTTNLNPAIQRYFRYGAFSYATPRRWQLRSPDGPWVGAAECVVESEFPINALELWLDGRRLDRREIGGAKQARLSLDLRGIEPDDYVLLARLWDQEGAIFERARRVTVN